ncbi:hypothetical protein [Flavobacterium sp. ABG]|uniref:hypothetical protein n=1 Tax=Flavobacterium sp. ABG TaxID=1423322 RepID=UPI001039AAA1|nr:hypothetical protein [Flavobacterium sp. ABG]
MYKKQLNDMFDTQVILNALESSIIPSLVALVATKIIEGNIKNSFDKKLEKTKMEQSIEISKFQTELNSLKSKENFKFTKLHEQRFEVLKTTYTLLNKTRNDLALFVSEIKVIPNNMTRIQREDKLSENFRTSHEEFIRYVDDNLIFFSDNLESIIAVFIEECFQIFINYDTNNVMVLAGLDDNEFKRKAFSAYKNIEEKIQPIMITIKKEIREVLGTNL